MMLLVAYPLAFIIATKVKQNFTRLVLFLFAAPFLVNYFIRTFSWADILARNGTINNLIVYLRFSDKPIDWLLYSNFAVYLGLISAYMPFMIFPIWLSLSGIDRRYVEASWMLGASPARTFWRVIFPLSLPGGNCSCNIWVCWCFWGSGRLKNSGWYWISVDWQCSHKFAKCA